MYDDNPVKYLLHLYEDGAFNRRELIDRLVKVTGSVAAATAAVESAGLLHAQAPACLEGVRVPEDAPDLDSSMITISGEASPIYGHLSMPKDAKFPLPAVVVIHENRGLNEHIKDVTRRVARAGYVAFGIDLLSRQGGTDQFPNPTDAGAAYNRTRPAENLADMTSAVLTLKDQSYVRGDRIGCIGFCAGGANSFALAVARPEITAAVIYYGGVPNPPDVFQNSNARFLGLYGEMDPGTNSGLPRLLTALPQYGKSYELHVYQGARHAFNNDTGASYNPTAACDAWEKTLAFFKRNLVE